MGTHDEETYKFFQNTGVTCVLFPRAGVNEQASLVHRNTTDRIFTHHQKTARLLACLIQGSHCSWFPQSPFEHSSAPSASDRDGYIESTCKPQGTSTCCALTSEHTPAEICLCQAPQRQHLKTHGLRRTPKCKRHGDYVAALL